MVLCKRSVSVSEVRMILFLNETFCNIYYLGKNVLKWLKITKKHYERTYHLVFNK